MVHQSANSTSWNHHLYNIYIYIYHVKWIFMANVKQISSGVLFTPWNKCRKLQVLVTEQCGKTLCKLNMSILYVNKTRCTTGANKLDSPYCLPGLNHICLHLLFAGNLNDKSKTFPQEEGTKQCKPQTFNKSPSKKESWKTPILEMECIFLQGQNSTWNFQGVY